MNTLLHIQDRAKSLITRTGDNRRFILVLVCSVLVRVVLLVLISDFPMIADSHGYHWQAVSLLEGRAFSPYFPPGTSFYLVPFYWLFGSSLIVGRIAFLLLWIIFAILFYSVAKLFVSSKAALVSVSFLSFFPDWIYHSTLIWSQLLTATCIILVIGITYILGGGWGDSSRLGATGICIFLGITLGFVGLVRPSALLVIVVILLYLILKDVNLYRLFLIIFAMFVIICAWVVVSYQMTESITFINMANSYNLFLGNNEFTPLYRTWLLSWDEENRPNRYLELVQEIQNRSGSTEDAYRAAAFEHIIHKPHLFVVRTLNRIRAYWGYDVFFGQHLARGYQVSPLLSGLVIVVNALMWFALVSFALLTVTTPIRKVLCTSERFLIGGIILAYSFSIWLVFSHPNYHFPIVPLVTIYASVSMENLHNHLTFQHMKSFVNNLLKNKLFLLAQIIFILIQLEWTLIVYMEYTDIGYNIW